MTIRIQPSQAQITRDKADCYVEQIRTGNRSTRKSIFALEQGSAHLAFGYKTFGSFVDNVLCQFVPRSTINHHRKMAEIEHRVAESETVGHVRDNLLRELNKFDDRNQKKIWLEAKRRAEENHYTKVTIENLMASAKDLEFHPKKATNSRSSTDRKEPKTSTHPVKQLFTRAIEDLNDEQLARLHAKLTDYLGYHYVP